MRSKHTEEQLAWLKNHLPKYEQKTSGATRGDAKKFALDCAATYIQLWGLPKTGNGDEEKESVVKEQIYTWFKNSCARGKDARMKHQQKKNAQQAHPPPPPGHHPGHHYPHHHPVHHGHHGHPPQHLPYPGPPLHHQHPPRPPHPSLQHDDLRRRESLTLPPIHAYHPRPPSPGSSNSSARGSPVLRPVYPPPPPPRHPHHLPPTSSLRSTHALSIDTVPSAPPPGGQGQGQGQQNLAARLLALAAGAKVVDVAADALATPNPAPRVVDALFAAAASTSNASSSTSNAHASSSSASSSSRPGATLPTPVSVGGGSPVRSVGMDVDDDDADADAEGEPESPAEQDDVPLTVTSPSPSASLRRSLSHSPSPSRSAPTPTLPELLRAFAQLLNALPASDAAAARAALHCALRRPPPLPPASSPSPSTSTMHDFRERAESVRRLRREHVLWARVLSACLSDCPHLLGPDEELREWRWFVRGCVKDALVSDDEEAGWLAGAYLLRGLRAEEREEGLVRAYESRWRDVRDERRLSEMGDVMVDLRH